MKTLFIPVLLLAFVFSAAAEVSVNQLDFDCTPEAKKRYVAQPYSWWGRGLYPVKKDEQGKIITLTNSRTRYVFFLFGKVNAKGEWFPTIGMVRPSKANWGQGGFLNFKSGKLKSKQCSVKVTDTAQGGFTLIFSTAGYEAKCRLELKKDDDRLYMLFEAPGTTSIQLTTYPSSYAGNYSRGKALRKRYAVTPLRRIPMEKDVDLNSKEYYALLGDSYFDPAANRGEGPCAVIYDPAKAKCRLSVQNYGCSVTLTGKDRIPFVLFDFKGTSNAEGERILKELPVSFR